MYNNRDLEVAAIDSRPQGGTALRGIKTDHEFAIYNSFNNSFRYAKVPTVPSSSISQYQVPLYYIGLQNAIMLSVYFPNKTNYILGNYIFPVGIGLLVVLVIIGLFVYSIRIIYRERRVSEIKNDLINNITHELKTPISIISLACQALNDEDMAKIEGIRTNYLNMIAQENKRLGSLVENILQSAVMEKGDFKIKIKKVNVHEKVEAALKSFKMKLGERNFNVVLDLNANPPVLEADDTHFTNMVFNLVDNAIKYSKPNEKGTFVAHCHVYERRGFVLSGGRQRHRHQQGRPKRKSSINYTGEHGERS